MEQEVLRLEAGEVEGGQIREGLIWLTGEVRALVLKV